MVKTKKQMIARGVRFEVEAWKTITALAELESVNTSSKVTPSDVARHACELYINKNKNKLDR